MNQNRITDMALAIEKHRQQVSRAQFRKDLKAHRGMAGFGRVARKMVFGSYGRGLQTYFDSKNLKAH